MSSTSKILIVEDESIVALDIQARLSRMGYQVVGTAVSGEEAIKLAAEYRPDLALMDIRLRGGMDGVETAQQLGALYGIPVVYLTAYADQSTLQRAKLTGPLGFLVKPFEERELHSTIEMALYKIEMEKRSRSHAARLERVVSTVPEGVALLDAQFRVLLANTRAQDYLTDLAKVSVGDMVERLGDTPVEQLLITSDSETWHEITTTGASSRVFEAILSPTQSNPEDTSDASSEWVLVIREVTAEREIQQRIQLQDRLAVVGQFAAGIAHDFNNILASIILSPYMIQKIEPNLSSRSKDRLDTIADQAERASALITQILDFSRASAMAMQPFDLRPLVKELAKMLERILPDDVTLHLVYGQEVYALNGDSTRILQLMMNLVLNARDAMPDGGELRVELARVYGGDKIPNCASENDEWIMISVSDNGTGIHPDTLKHVFEPFFTTKPTGHGTGLGLAQVYGIVQQHGGCINVDSRLGQGTTFSAYFPSLQQSAPDGVELGSEQSPPVPGNQQTILLVEDNEEVRESIYETLELMNYHVLTASNGREALAIVEQAPSKVDLILSDLTMPDMGGLELSRELKRRNLGTKIMILTGYMSDEIRQELEALSVTDCLSKPIEIRQLLRAIDAALQ